MASPVADAYTAPSGVVLRAGRFASRLAGAVALDALVAAGSLAPNPSALAGGITLADAAPGGALAGYVPPAWLTAGSVLAYGTIPNTSGWGAVEIYSGLSLREGGGVVQLAALPGGGHYDSADNGVYAADLTADAPTVATLKAKTSTGNLVNAANYYADGAPSARHSYWFNHWVPEKNRYMMFGAKTQWAISPTGPTDSLKVDGFNPATGAWDAAGTNPDLPNAAQMSVRDPSTGNLWGPQGSTLLKFDPNAGTFTTVTQSGTGTLQRGACAFDTVRNRIYHLCSGNNFDTGSSTITSVAITPAGVKTPVTLSGSGLAQFQADAPGFLTSELVYDSRRDCFYFYDGFSAGTGGRVYKIVPVDATSATITILATSGVSVALSARGICGRFKYCATYDCLLVLPTSTSNIHFLRLS